MYLGFAIAKLENLYMWNCKAIFFGTVVLLFSSLVSRGQETSDSLRFQAADSLQIAEPVYFAPFNPSFSKFLLLTAPDGPLSKEELAMKANMYARQDIVASMSWTLDNTILNPMVYELRSLYSRTGPSTTLYWIAPFSNPFGYVPIMNSSNPFAIAKIPGWTPEPYRYSPDIFPQWIELEYDEANGIFRQVPVSWEDYNEKIRIGGGGKYGNDPIPAAAITPVERSIQSLW